MTQIYVIEGGCRSYDDSHQWIVKAFKSKEKALKYTGELDKIVEDFGTIKEYLKKNPDNYSQDYETDLSLKLMDLDPHNSCAWSSPYYRVVVTDLEDE